MRRQLKQQKWLKIPGKRSSALLKGKLAACQAQKGHFVGQASALVAQEPHNPHSPMSIGMFICLEALQLTLPTGSDTVSHSASV